VDYYAHVTAPFLSRLGLSASVTCLQRGYYPRGGGTLRLQVEPWKDRRALGRLSFSEPKSVTVSSSSAGLPDRVAQEQAEAAASALSAYEMEVLLDRTGHGTGSAITVWADAGGFPVGASCIGRKGLPAREVGLAAAKEFLSVLDARAADPHLPDQVLPFMAMADGCSSLPLSEVTSHLTTMQWLVRNVAALPVTVEGGMLFVG
jgi:RNA 3'-terminal phosphate cyclase